MFYARQHGNREIIPTAAKTFAPSWCRRAPAGLRFAHSA